MRILHIAREIRICDFEKKMNERSNDVLMVDYLSISSSMVKDDAWDMVLIETTPSKELTQYVCAFFADHMQVPIMIWVKDKGLYKCEDFYRFGATDVMTDHLEDDVIAKIEALDLLLGLSPRIVEVSDSLIMERASRRVYVEGSEIYLANKEFELLFMLKNTPDKVFNKIEIYDEIWQQNSFGDYVTVAVHIRRIRNKIRTVSDHEFIETVRGVGYRYVAG